MNDFRTQAMFRAGRERPPRDPWSHCDHGWFQESKPCLEAHAVLDTEADTFRHTAAGVHALRPADRPISGAMLAGDEARWPEEAG